MQIKYEKCLVGFIDVMGFTEMLGDSEKNKAKLSDYFNEISIETMQTNNGDIGIRAFAISDSVIYSIPMSGDQVEDMDRMTHFVHILADLQLRLAIKHCIWTRGAISIGDLQMEEKSKFIVGQAFVDAYLLEKSANYPRIIFHPNVFKHFKSMPHGFVEVLNIFTSSPVLEFSSRSPANVSPWPNDYVQIDWLNTYLSMDTEQIRSKGYSIKTFLEDLEERQSSGVNLFRKAHDLLRYMQQSIYFYQQSNPDYKRKPHILQLIEEMKDLTGVDQSKIVSRIVGRE